MVTPPLGGVRPSGDQTCGRLTPGGHCGAPAIQHIAWTPDIHNGLVCPTHWDEARRTWAFYDHHPLTALCALNDAGVLWLDSRQHPPGYCAQAVDGDVVYIEVYGDVPADVQQAALPTTPPAPTP